MKMESQGHDDALGSITKPAATAAIMDIDDAEIDLDEYRSSNNSGFKGVYQIAAHLFEASVWDNGQKRRLGRYRWYL